MPPKRKTRKAPARQVQPQDVAGPGAGPNQVAAAPPKADSRSTRPRLRRKAKGDIEEDEQNAENVPDIPAAKEPKKKQHTQTIQHPPAQEDSEEEAATEDPGPSKGKGTAKKGAAAKGKAAKKPRKGQLSGSAEPEEGAAIDAGGAGGAQKSTKGKGKQKAVEPSDEERAAKRPRLRTHSDFVGENKDLPAILRKPVAMGKQPEKVDDESDKDEGENDGGENVRWEAVQPLGAGGHGAACIWFAINENDAITDRVVVKDTWLPPETIAKCHQWHGDIRDPQKRKHIEIAAMKHYRGKPGAGQRLITLRGSAQDKEVRWYRVYQSFCPCGDLFKVSKWYLAPDFAEDPDGDLRKRHGVRKADITDLEVWTSEDQFRTTLGKREQFIPEPFIWWMFLCLVEGCLVLETGAIEEDERPKAENWTHMIVHRDLKPGNIFLDEPEHGDNVRFPSYPQAKIGDFGISLLTNEDDPNNPALYCGDEGTNYWQPVEMTTLLDVKTAIAAPVGGQLVPTNVWGIGTILTALMTRMQNCFGAGFNEPQKDYWGADEFEQMQPWFEPLPRQHYSQELQDLVRGCECFRPEDRAGLRTFRELILARIEERDEVEEGNDEEDRGVRRMYRHKHADGRGHGGLKLEGWALECVENRHG
jgi:serine/threonine protein kinase